MKPMKASRSLFVAGALLVVSIAPRVWACPVCYGESDSGFLDGARLSVIFMGILTYALIGGGLGIFLALRRRVRRLQEGALEDSRRGLRLIANPASPEEATP